MSVREAAALSTCIIQMNYLIGGTQRVLMDFGTDLRSVAMPMRDAGAPAVGSSVFNKDKPIDAVNYK